MSTTVKKGSQKSIKAPPSKTDKTSKVPENPTEKNNEFEVETQPDQDNNPPLENKNTSKFAKDTKGSVQDPSKIQATEYDPQGKIIRTNESQLSETPPKRSAPHGKQVVEPDTSENFKLLKRRMTSQKRASSDINSSLINFNNSSSNIGLSKNELLTNMSIFAGKLSKENGKTKNFNESILKGSQSRITDNVSIAESKLFENKEANLESIKDMPENSGYELYDMVFPHGNLAQQAKIQDMKSIGETEILQILDQFKDFDEPYPVIIISGLKVNPLPAEFMSGIARAAYRTDAVIIDNGVKTGIEPNAIMKTLKLFGIAPEREIKYPKINPTITEQTELANGHSHLFIIADPNEKYDKWGSEAKLKFLLANCISKGTLNKKATGTTTCKKVVVCFGEDKKVLDDIKQAIDNDQPIILISGGDISDKIISYILGESKFYNESVEAMLDKGHFYVLNKHKPEDLASFIHFFLNCKPW